MTPMTSALMVSTAARSGFGSGVFGVVISVFIISEAPATIGFGEDQQSDDQNKDQNTQNASNDDANGVGWQIAIVVGLFNSEFN